ncbi:MAG: ABC transporter ATP-binding protein [Thermomicrobiales bacterium]|nr:ABC transporter ATP-binding protein [Thermomicrobiales bacterium]
MASAPGQPKPILSIRDLSATYAEQGAILPVLDRVDLDVGEGEFVALIGPSGSGKSTLLDIVAGLIEPDRGEIRLFGEIHAAERRLGRSAYMQQRDLLLPWRTAVANAALALEVKGVDRRTARDQATQRFIDLGLQGFETVYPAQLSGGMRQRVAFVRTMLGGQRLILLDEPFGSLDALTRASAQDWLLDVLSRDQRSALLVTHDVDEAILLADRVVVLSGRPGRVIHQEPVVLPRPRTRDMIASAAFVAARIRLLEQLGLVHAGAGS